MSFVPPATIQSRTARRSVPRGAGHQGGRRGAVIVVVLAIVMLASLLLHHFIERAMTDMIVESRARAAERLRGDARSALEASLAVIADFQAIDGGLRSPAQGWGEPLAGREFPLRPDLEVAVQVEDESGRISLPRLGREDLERLGVQLGLKPADAARLADALLAWTKRDHATTRFETDPRNYEYEDPPHRPPGRPLASFAELAAVAVARDMFFNPDGEPTELLRSFERAVSLHHFPAINLNTARAEALQLARADEAQIARIREYTSSRASRPAGTPPYFRTLAEAQALLGAAVPLGGFDTTARCLRIRVAVKEGATTFRLTAVVVPLGAPPAPGEADSPPPADAGELQYPFKLLAWEETIELTPTPAS